MINKIYHNLGLLILHTFDFLVSRYTENKPILSANELSFVRLLQKNRLVFLNEYLQASAQRSVPNIKDFYKVETDLKEDENWKAIPIVLFGHHLQRNPEQFPLTIELLKELPGCCGAMFSVLGPGKHIPLHKGIYKGIYRCLFTLQMAPEADCWIRVGNSKLNFVEGGTIVFDETVEHEVKNSSNSPRIVLYLDLYRNLPFPLNWLNDFVFFLLKKSRFVSNILKEYQKIEAVSISSFDCVAAPLQV